MMNGDAQALTLLVSFARALLHKIRTPLAVVSNELSYFHSGAAVDCTVASRRVQEIASILRESIPFSSLGLHVQDLPLSEVADAFQCDVSESNFPLLRADPVLLEETGTLLLKALAEWGGAIKKRGKVYSRSSEGATVSPEESTVVLEMSYPITEPVTGPVVQGQSLTAMINDRLGISAVESPLVDALLAAQGIKSSYEFGDFIRVQLTFRRSEVQ